jgi:ABC-type transport system substrate-binding protein
MLTAKAVAAYDHAARKAVYIQLQRLWNSDLPVVPLAWDEAIYVVNSDMHGFQAEPVNSDFWNVNEWKI